MEITEKYVRHLSLEDVGFLGQKKISESKILIVGAGGLGVPACLYLASSGVGVIGICDGDIIEISNLSRQVLYHKNDVGQKKVHVLSERVSYLNPEIKMCTYDFHLTEQNAKKIFKDYDLIINGSDNFKTRHIINKNAVELALPWVDAAVSKFSGQVSCFLPYLGCYHCLFSEVKESENNCNGLGVLAPLCGMFGAWAAVNALKIILSMVHENVFFEFDAKKNKIKHFNWKKRDNCVLCQNKTPMGAAANSQARLQDNQTPKYGEIKSPLGLSLSKLALLPNFILIDLSPFQKTGSDFIETKNRISASLEDFFSENLEDPVFIQRHQDKTQTYVCVCEASMKSKIAAQVLVQEGFNAFFLER